MNLDLYNKQLEEFKKIILSNEKIVFILKKLQEYNLEDYYLGAGCISQTFFNYYHGYNLEKNINDYDIVYFDNDLSYEKEDKIIKDITFLLRNIDVQLDIKNQARVHLWSLKSLGRQIKQINSLEQAVRGWGTTVTCIGIRLKNDDLEIFAPYGLNDLFDMNIVPLKDNIPKEEYLKKVKKWKEKWPLLNINEW